MLISEEYRRLNAQLHDEVPAYGTSGRYHIDQIRTLAAQYQAGSLLDYGCGKQIIAQTLGKELDVRSYDPCIKGLDQPPVPAEMLVCVDVLEHIEPECLDDVLSDIARLMGRAALLTISTRPAKKTLADGSNCHRIIKDRDWWVYRLGRHFRVASAEDCQHDDAIRVVVEPREQAHCLSMTAGGSDAIRVCIGTERRTMVPCRVLEYSILKHVPKGTKVEFHHLLGGDWKDYGPGEQYTGFSFLRWTIPQKFNSRGKAIYLDADQLCLSDIGELWASDRVAHHPDVCVWCTYYDHRTKKLFGLLRTKQRISETSVMLIDCAKASGRLMTPEQIQEYIKDDPDKKKYREVMHATYLTPRPQEISPWWNLMDGRGNATEEFTNPRARLLHFTKVATQPWYDADHPKRGVWEAYFQEALDTGYIGRADVKEACSNFSLERARPDGMHPYWKRYAA